MTSLFRIAYRGWPNVLHLRGRRVELLITADVGPRILRFGFRGGRNLFHEVPRQGGLTDGADWRMYGGHRLWVAPESARSYAADNRPVTWFWRKEALLLRAERDRAGLVKWLKVRIDARDRVQVEHTVTNAGRRAVTLAPWAISVMAAGGRAIVPQEPFRLSDDYKLPARSLALWHYTDMRDPRWTWGSRFIQLRHDARAPSVQKLGVWNRQGWAAYALGDLVYVKRFPARAGARHPEFGSNNEVFAHWDFIEIESLGALVTLQPGQSASHAETWSLHRKKLPASEDALARALRGVLR